MPPNEGVVTEGGGPATSFIEAPATEIPAEGESISSDVNWSDIATELETADSEALVEGDAVVVETASPPPPPVPAPVPAATPAAGDPPPPVSSPAAAPTPSEPAAPVSVAPETPAVPATPAAPAVDYQTWKAEQLAKLENVYKLNDETAAQLMTEPEVVLPKMAAHLHMAVTEAVLHSINNALPQVLESITASKDVEQRAMKMFNDANPDLADPKFRTNVLQIGQMYRQVNPKAPPEEAVRVIGNMVRTALGMQAPAPAAAPSPQGGPPPAPQQPAPFVPVRGGGGGVAPAAPANPWAALAQELSMEDD